MRLPLGAVPFYRDAPEGKKPRTSGSRTVQLFMAGALPQSARSGAKPCRRLHRS
jgi:hypothetical protein